MLARLRLRSGSSPEGPPLEFVPGPMTVFVGPNNSGKSLVLREVVSAVTTGGAIVPGESGIIAGGRIVDRIELRPISREEVFRALFGSAGPPGEPVVPGQLVGVRARPSPPGAVLATGTVFDLSTLFSNFSDDVYVGPGGHAFVAALTLPLDGQTRLMLTTPQQSGDLLAPPHNFLMALFQDDQARGRIREILAEAFPGLYFVVDPTSMQQLRVRMSPRPPADPQEEQSLDARTRAFYAQAIPIEELSDGVRAFTGLVAAVFAADYRTVLIDEPEAFLHPPLARKLGAVLAQLAGDRDGNVFAATHSPEFLLGCLQAGGPVNIVRLTYSAGMPGARLLPGTEIQRLMRDPLLRSTGVLNALFHVGAVLCEGGVDRAFYEEINRRLRAAGRGAGDVLFIDGIGKQSLHHLVAPLRGVGVPAAVIVDLDILKEGDLRRLLLAASVPEGLADSWDELKRRVNAAFRGRGLDPKHAGLDVLDAGDRAMAESLIADVARYGVFIVPVGEVEHWLAPLGATGQKGRWLMAMFERLGSDPAAVDYAHPAAGDVWAFIDDIAGWIGDPARQGMPA